MLDVVDQEFISSPPRRTMAWEFRQPRGRRCVLDKTALYQGGTLQHRAEVPTDLFLTSMSSLPAIRLVASSTKSARAHVHLQCHVKPGASKQREGITSVSDTVIEVCVSARAREASSHDVT
jgi:hypothetical protein